MSDRKLRWLGFALTASVGAGVVGLSAMINPAFAHADDIGLVIGGSGQPIPGSDIVEAANQLYLDNPLDPIYPGLTFYQATPANPFGNGLFTPEGLYPLTGVHTLLFNYPSTDGFPSESTSAGQGMTILESTIAADTAAGDTSTVFGESQSATIASLVMQQLDPSGTPDTSIPAQFLLIGDPSAPNGGLLERFAGFETLSGQTTSLPLNLPSLGVSFDGATPADDFTTYIYSNEYDGFADFPQYPLNFLADLNAFLGIETLHGAYSGITANEVLLPGSALSGTTDSLTNYYMTLETPPLVSLLSDMSKPLGDLLGPDLTVLINLGYGSLTQGYSTGPANVDTPFGLWPTDISTSDLLTALEQGAEQGISAFKADLADPAAWLPSAASSSATSLTDLWSALSADAADPAATLTDLVNAISSAASTAYSTLQPTADIINALVTSMPAYDVSLFTDNLSSGDLLDALGLPVAADTALITLSAGFEYSVISDAISQISADFSGLF